MGHSKLGERLLDAHMMGDKEAAKAIQAEIDSLAEKSRPKNGGTFSINTLLNNDKASAILVYDFLNKAFGPDWWEWEIETLEKLLWVNYGTVLEDVNRDKVLSIRHACRSDRPFSNWFEFNQVALAFAGAIADFEYLRKPSAGMLINAVKTLKHIRPDLEGKFDEEVLKYICLALKDDGIYVPPPSLVMMIKDVMKNLISKESKDIWMKIYNRYKAIVSNEDNGSGENIEDIQAKRIIRAEAAAVEYGSVG